MVWIFGSDRAGRNLLSDEHFTVDGTLLEAWAGQKSFRRVDDDQQPPTTGTGGGSNPTVNFHGEKRSNQTHCPTTYPDAMKQKDEEYPSNRVFFSSLLSLLARLRSRRQAMVALGLSNTVLPDLVEKRLVADLEQCRGLLAVPIGLIECFGDCLGLGFILCASRH